MNDQLLEKVRTITEARWITNGFNKLEAPLTNVEPLGVVFKVDVCFESFTDFNTQYLEPALRALERAVRLDDNGQYHHVNVVAAGDIVTLTSACSGEDDPTVEQAAKRAAQDAYDRGVKNEAAIRRLEEDVKQEQAERARREEREEQARQEELKRFDVFPGKDFGTIPEEFLNDKVEPSITFEEYQFGAKKTAIYNKDARVLYPALGLTGEVAEVIEKVLGMAKHAGLAANQVKKIIRDDDCECDTPRKHDIGKEIGGVLWYCAAVCSDLDLSLGDIAQQNLDILADRQKRGTVQGDGDDR